MKTISIDVMVGFDYAGHYVVVERNNRIAVMNFLQETDDGDVWVNRENHEEFPDNTDWNTLSQDKWEEFIREFTQYDHIGFSKVEITLPE